jgi:4-hydroxy-tetrahydrodipicolinate reductase
MKKIRLGLLGASGKMGLALRSVLSRQRGFSLSLAVSSKETPEFKSHYQNVNDLDPDSFRQVDVWIDFTNPDYLAAFLKKAKGHTFRMVSGTTGMSTRQFANFRKQSQQAALFWASNMSPGLWALRQSLQALALIPEFSVTIEETHHTEKRDNPSGTALTLHKDIESILGRRLAIPVGHRLPNVFGVHEITVASDGEVLKFSHTALNRTVFAQGALKAAAFLVKRRRGLYSMADIYRAK